MRPRGSLAAMSLERAAALNTSLNTAAFHLAAGNIPQATLANTWSIAIAASEDGKPPPPPPPELVLAPST